MFCSPFFALGLLLASAPQEAPASVNHEADIDYNLDVEGPRMPYQDSEIQPSANLLDVYWPSDKAKDRPIVIFVHGGGWMIGDKDRTHFKDEFFTDAGHVFISVNYRLSPAPIDLEFPSHRVRSPQHVEDLAEAIRWAHDNAARFGGDNSKITLIGHSAGGQLVSLVATDPSYLQAREVPLDVIQGVVALDGSNYDVKTSIQGSTAPSMLYQAFGTARENDESGIWSKLSATTHAGPEDPPFLLVTQSRNRKRIAQCRALAAALGQNPEGAVLPIDKTHQEINRHLGDPADSSIMTAKVLAFVQRTTNKTS